MTLHRIRIILDLHNFLSEIQSIFAKFLVVKVSFAKLVLEKIKL